jgi:Icc-related predicted phosphoesterase
MDIDGRIVTVKGVRIAGFEGCFRYNQGECQYTERQMALRVWRSRLRASHCGAPDIVVTHAPPSGCHEGDDVCHRGFQSFRTAIAAWEPAVFVHGHTHAYNGPQREEVVGSTRVINAFPHGMFEVPLPSDVRARERETRPVERTSRVVGEFLPAIRGHQPHV